MARKTLDSPVNREGDVEFMYGGVRYAEPMANLHLEAMTPLEIRTALDRVTPKFAFWSSKLADLSKVIRETETAYEMWFAEKYAAASGRWTEAKSRYIAEGTKRNEVILNNVKEYKKWQSDLSELSFVKDKMSLLVKSFEMQSRMLQTIASLMKTEMGMLGKEE
jgi:hypothetical protein